MVRKVRLQGAHYYQHEYRKALHRRYSLSSHRYKRMTDRTILLRSKSFNHPMLTFGQRWL